MRAAFLAAALTPGLAVASLAPPIVRAAPVAPAAVNDAGGRGAADGGAAGSGSQTADRAVKALSQESPRALLERVLHRYGSYGDFQARFVETAIGRASGEGPPESGTVSFKRPDLWRWEYSDPEKKLVVIRAAIATIAVEGDSEVTRYDLGGPDERSGIGALLAGNETLAKLFSVKQESGTAGEPVLRLDPIKLTDEYDHVLLRVRRRDLTILEVQVVDPGGNVLRFVVSGFRGNVGLSPSLFEPPALPAAPSPASQGGGRPSQP